LLDCRSEAQLFVAFSARLPNGFAVSSTSRLVFSALSTCNSIKQLNWLPDEHRLSAKMQYDCIKIAFFAFWSPA